jgi:hypothetical protein
MNSQKTASRPAPEHFHQSARAKKGEPYNLQIIKKGK